MTDRKEFLLEMYRQMMNDINRHITVIWQSVGVLVGALAVFALVEKQVMSLDIAATIIVVICGWLLAHLLDASYWYNRNLVIIANIERQFLLASDLHDIHYYFGKHRPNNKMISHLRIQGGLGVGLAAVIVLYHFLGRVLPGFSAPMANFQLVRALPYVVAAATIYVVSRVTQKMNRSYEEFVANSPGVAVDTSNVSYGIGHGFGD